MTFNELNSVEHFIIRQLTGTNLNSTAGVSEPTTEYGNGFWKYVSAEDLKREISEVLVEGEVKEALIRLNPEIAILPDRAEEVIHKLRAILLTVNQVGLVRANEDFAKWLGCTNTDYFNYIIQRIVINPFNEFLTAYNKDLGQKAIEAQVNQAILEANSKITVELAQT